MRRRLYGFAVLASLLLCAGVLALWIRSYRVTQFVGWSGTNRFVGSLSMSGVVRFEYGSYGPGSTGWKHVSYDTPAGGLWNEIRARDRSGGWLTRIGIAGAVIDYTGNGSQMRYAVYVPHWVIGAILLVLPAAWALRKFLRQYPPGCCRVCGYDLRATPERCPECGTVSLAQRPADRGR